MVRITPGNVTPFGYPISSKETSPILRWQIGIPGVPCSREVRGPLPQSAATRAASAARSLPAWTAEGGARAPSRASRSKTTHCAAKCSGLGEPGHIPVGQAILRRAIVFPWLRGTVSRGFECLTGDRAWSYSTDAHMPNWACQAPSSFDSGGRESCAIVLISQRLCAWRCFFRSPGSCLSPLWPGLLLSRQSRISSGRSSAPSPASRPR
jgi:hypothetical protein